MPRNNPPSLSEKFRHDRVRISADFSIAVKDLPKLVDAFRHPAPDAVKYGFPVYKGGASKPGEPEAA